MTFSILQHKYVSFPQVFDDVFPVMENASCCLTHSCIREKKIISEQDIQSNRLSYEHENMVQIPG